MDSLDPLPGWPPYHTRTTAEMLIMAPPRHFSGFVPKLHISHLPPPVGHGMEASVPSLCCACAGGNGENSPIRSSLWCRHQARPGLLKGFQAVSEGGLCGAEKQNVIPLPLVSQLLENSKTCIQSKTQALSLSHTQSLWVQDQVPWA